jgi:phosphate transport system permease protein
VGTPESGRRDEIAKDAVLSVVDTSSAASAEGDLRLVSKATYLREKALENLFLLCAFMAVAGVLLIFLFVGLRGWPIFVKVGVWPFLTGTKWLPTKGSFGVAPLIINSFLVMIGALIAGTPLALGTAIFLSEVATPGVRAWVRPAVELLAGIPSVIYGFFGLVMLRPLITAWSHTLGFGLLAVSIVLGVMIVPTIAAISEDALRSLPNGIREASYAMGATTWQTIWRVLLPAAKLGIIDAIILGMGRAIGETMAVVMIAGNAPVVPHSLFQPLLTVTAAIVMDMSYASGDHRTALFGLAIILFLISMSFVAILRLLSRLGGDEA